MLATVVANRGSAKEIIEFREKVMFGATLDRCVSECVAFIYSTTVSHEISQHEADIPRKTEFRSNKPDRVRFHLFLVGSSALRGGYR